MGLTLTFFAGLSEFAVALLALLNSTRPTSSFLTSALAALPCVRVHKKKKYSISHILSNE